MSEFPVHSSDDQVGFSGPVEVPIVRRSSWWLWPALMFVGILNVGLVVAALRVEKPELKHELLNFAVTGLAILPLLPLVTLAQLGNRSASARMLAIGYWGFFAIASLAFVAIFTFGGVFDFALAETLQPDRALEAVAPGGMRKIAIAIGLGLFSILIGLVIFSEGGRTLASRFLPFDPNSFSSTTGLATVVVLLAVSLIPLIVLNQPPLLLLFQNTKALPDGPAVTNDMGIRSLYYELFWAVPFAIVAAGYPLTRSFRQALERLGVGRLSFVQLALSVVVAVALVCLMQVLGPAVNNIWDHMGWPKTDAKAFEDLFKFALNSSGAIAIGITAGVCEELAFRGLLQPRIGLLFSNLLFAAVHAFQYHWDALFIVFIIGLVCGIVRKRFNTTASIVVHGLYDTLVVLAVANEWIK